MVYVFRKLIRTKLYLRISKPDDMYVLIKNAQRIKQKRDKSKPTQLTLNHTTTPDWTKTKTNPAYKIFEMSLLTTHNLHLVL